MKRRAFGLALVVAIVASAPATAARKTPYWASLAAGEVMMRTGPGRNFPAVWLYKRRNLPVKVVKLYRQKTSEWRRIQDPDGSEGWVQANLLSDRRTALVVGDTRPMRARPEPSAPILWRAEPGVVGSLSKCSNGWCSLDVNGRAGFVEAAHVYGVTPGEILP